MHNQYVKKALQYYSIDTIEDKTKTRVELLDEIYEGIVIFTAHGVSPKVYEKAKEKGEICNATRVRQQAILDLKNVDCLIVVGDPTSNNSQKLVDIGKQAGIEHVFSIQTVEDIDKKDFEKYTTIAITSGASTPTYLTNQVKDYLSQDIEKPKIRIQEIL